MKSVAYSPTVFKTFIADFKALASSLENIQDDLYFKTKILPWAYSDNIDNMLAEINIMFESLSILQTGMYCGEQ